MSAESLPAVHLWIQSETQTIFLCQVFLESEKHAQARTISIETQPEWVGEYKQQTLGQESFL